SDLPSLRLILAVQQLDAPPVGRVDERDARGRVEIDRLQAEGDALAAQPGAEAVEIAPYAQAEVIDAPLQPGPGVRGFGGALSAYGDGRSRDGHVDLRRTFDFDAADDLAAQLFDVPGGGGFWVLRDERGGVGTESGVSHDRVPSTTRQTGFTGLTR